MYFNIFTLTLQDLEPAWKVEVGEGEPSQAPPAGAPPASPIIGMAYGPPLEVGEEEALQLRYPPPNNPPPVLPLALTCPEGATPEGVQSLRSTIMKVSITSYMIYTPGRGAV